MQTSSLDETRNKNIELLAGIVDEMKAGDFSRFNDCYDMTKQMVIFNIRANGVDERDVEDVAQEVYIKVYKNICDIDDSNRAYSWIKQVAARTAIDHFKRAYVKHESLLNNKVNEDGESVDDYSLFEVENSLTAPLPVPEDVMENKETQRLMQEIINGLPEKQYQAIVAFYFNERKVTEIAQDMQISTNTVKSLLLRGRNCIKEEVEKLAKEKGTKLYSVGTLPLMYFLFSEQIKSIILPASVDVAVKTAVAGTVGTAATTVTASTTVASAGTAVSTGATTAGAASTTATATGASASTVAGGVTGAVGTGAKAVTAVKAALAIGSATLAIGGAAVAVDHIKDEIRKDACYDAYMEYLEGESVYAFSFLLGGMDMDAENVYFDVVEITKDEIPVLITATGEGESCVMFCVKDGEITKFVDPEYYTITSIYPETGLVEWEWMLTNFITDKGEHEYYYTALVEDEDENSNYEIILAKTYYENVNDYEYWDMRMEGDNKDEKLISEKKFEKALAKEGGNNSVELDLVPNTEENRIAKLKNRGKSVETKAEAETTLEDKKDTFTPMTKEEVLAYFPEETREIFAMTNEEFISKYSDLSLYETYRNGGAHEVVFRTSYEITIYENDFENFRILGPVMYDDGTIENDRLMASYDYTNWTGWKEKSKIILNREKLNTLNNVRYIPHNKFLTFEYNELTYKDFIELFGNEGIIDEIWRSKTNAQNGNFTVCWHNLWDDEGVEAEQRIECTFDIDTGKCIRFNNICMGSFEE